MRDTRLSQKDRKSRLDQPVVELEATRARVTTAKQSMIAKDIHQGQAADAYCVWREGLHAEAVAEDNTER